MLLPDPAGPVTNCMKHLPIFVVFENFRLSYIMRGGITVSDCVGVLTVHIKKKSVHIMESIASKKSRRYRTSAACYFIVVPTIKNEWNKRARKTCHD